MDITKIVGFILALVVAALPICVICALVIRVVRLRRRRIKALEALAPELGFSFLDEVGFAGDQEVQTLKALLQRDGRGAFSNTMEGTVSGLRALLFDWRDTSGHKTHVRTIAAFANVGCNLPRFELKKQQWLPAGNQRIEFQEIPAFSKNVIVTGDDAASIRRLFTPQVCDFVTTFMSDKKWRIQGHQKWLVFYHPDNLLSPSMWRGFLEDTSQIASRLLESARAG